MFVYCNLNPGAKLFGNPSTFIFQVNISLLPLPSEKKEHYG
jgi:hypothetical protein